jgi:cephalosporin hydroxylase
MKAFLWLFIGLVVSSVFWNSLRMARTRPDETKAYHVWTYADMETGWKNTNWLGVSVLKLPLDLWIYQEIIYETKPDVLIEAGTYKGGSAYFFASIFDLMKHGRVLTIDIQDFPDKPKHDRVTFFLGSSTSDAVFNAIRAAIKPGEHVMVSLDSDHHRDHVLKELRLYSPLVTVGDYLVVEDTDINGHPLLPNYGPGPMEAVQEFLSGNHDFISDHAREKFGVTSFPEGWLKRIR